MNAPPYNHITCPHCGFVNVVADLHIPRGNLSGTAQHRLYCGACGHSWIYTPPREPPRPKGTTPPA